MKEYIDAEMKIVRFEVEDVITESQEGVSGENEVQAPVIVGEGEMQ